MKNCYTISRFLAIIILLNSITVFAQDGQLDTTFAGTGGTVVYIGSSGNDEAHSVNLESDGKIVAAGFAYFSSSNEYAFALMRFKENGTLDSTFGDNGIVTTGIGGSNTEAKAYSSLIQPDGKIIAAGYSSTGGLGSQRVFALIRYKTNGSIDSTFGTNGIVTTAIDSSDDEIFSIAIQKDGKIVAGGYSFKGYLSSGQTYIFALARYNTDGSLDKTFGSNGIVTTSVLPSSAGGEDDEIHSLAIQPNGKIIAAGYSYGGFALARYNTDGSLDNSFGSQGVVITYISGLDYNNSVSLQTNGKIIAAGSSYINSQYACSIARYDSNGTLDNSFGNNGIVTTTIGSYDDAINSTAIQKDGKIVAAGYTQNNSQQFLFALIRYNSDGSLDKTFGINGIDTTVVGLGDDKAYSVVIQNDGKIVAAGASMYNNFYDLYGFAVLRYTGSSEGINSVNYTGTKPDNFHLFQNYPNPFNPETKIKFAIPHGGNVTLKIYDILGREISTLVNGYKIEGNYSVEFNADNLSSGIYFYELRFGNLTSIKKMILLK